MYVLDVDMGHGGMNGSGGIYEAEIGNGPAMG